MCQIILVCFSWWADACQIDLVHFVHQLDELYISALNLVCKAIVLFGLQKLIKLFTS